MQTRANALSAPHCALPSRITQKQLPNLKAATAGSFRLAVPAHRRSPAQGLLRCPQPQPAPLSLSSERLPEVASVSRHTPVCGPGVSYPSQEKEVTGTSGQVHTPVTGMAKGLGSRGGGATLQRSKLDQRQEVKSWTPGTDNSGGGGIGGKNIFNGGGGGDDGGDDDDYFDNFDEGDGDGDGDGLFRKVVMAQLYDKASINAVLQEWFRTIGDMPLILRQAVEMGLFSSAQLVRFLQMDYRPSVARAVARKVPTPVSRGLVGRMMADPAFLQKLGIEQVLTAGSSLLWEWQQRGERFSKELDLVAINTLSLMAANGALVWMVSPNRSFGAAHKLPWQNALHSLPNNIFDMSGPQRNYTTTSRGLGFAAKAVELTTVGMLAGVAMSGLSQAAVALRRRADPGFRPSVPIPTLSHAAGGMAVSMGVFANFRYQLISGVDRYLFDHSNHLLSYLTSSGILRTVSNRLGEPTRLSLQGLPVDPPRRILPQPAQQHLRSSIVVEQPGAAPKRKVVPKGGKKLKKKTAKGFEMSAAVSAA